MHALGLTIETSRRRLFPTDPGYVDCTPDIHVPDILNVSADTLASLGVKNILVDFDGTIAANGNNPPAPSATIAHLGTLAADERFDNFAIATNNPNRYVWEIAESIGTNTSVFQPKESPRMRIQKPHLGFYKRILFELDIWDTPELACMIGDSYLLDIQPAQAVGMKTVLVDRLERKTF